MGKGCHMETGCPGDGSSFPPAAPGFAVLVLECAGTGQEEGWVKTCPPSACPTAEGLSNHPSWPRTPGNVDHTVLWGIRWLLSLETIFFSLVAVWEPTQFVKSNANRNSESARQLCERRCEETLPAPRFHPPPRPGCSLSVPWQGELGCWQGKLQGLWVPGCTMALIHPHCLPPSGKPFSPVA